MKTVLESLDAFNKLRNDDLNQRIWASNEDAINLVDRYREYVPKLIASADSMSAAWSADYKQGQGHIMELLAQISRLEGQLETVKKKLKLEKKTEAKPSIVKCRQYLVCCNADLSQFQRFNTQEEAKDEVRARLASTETTQFSVLSLVASVKIEWD